jgi:transposase
MLRWARNATSVRAAQWRVTHFSSYALKCIARNSKALAEVLKALITLEEHAHLVLRRGTSNYCNARMEGLNGILRAA